MSDMLLDAKAAAERLNGSELSMKLCWSEIQAVLDKYEYDLVFLENRVNGQVQQAGIGVVPRPPRPGVRKQ